MVLFRTESIISAEERRNVRVGFSQFFLALLQEADSLVLNPTCKSSKWLSCPSNKEDSRLLVMRIVWNVENLVSVQTSPLCGSLPHLSSSLLPSPPFLNVYCPSASFSVVLPPEPLPEVACPPKSSLSSTFCPSGQRPYMCEGKAWSQTMSWGFNTLALKSVFLDCKMSKFFSGKNPGY